MRISPGGSTFSTGSPQITTTQFTLTTVPVMVAAADSKRRMVGIAKFGGRDVFVGKDATVSSTNGFLWAGTKGASIVLETAAEVWMVLASGTEQIAVLEESNF